MLKRFGLALCGAFFVSAAMAGTLTERLDKALLEVTATKNAAARAEYAIKRAVIDFCAGSWIWKHIPDPIDTTAGENTYDLEPPPATDITTVMSVALNNVPLTNKSLDWLDGNLPGWRTNTATPKHFTQVDTEQVIVAPVPPVVVLATIVAPSAIAGSN